MKPRSFLPALLLAFAPVFSAQADPFAELVRPTDPRTPQEELAGFHVPPGFHAQLVASEPVVHKPMNLAFDAKGRLWCTSSGEYPWAVPREKWKTPEGLLESSRDKILIMEDTNGDGLPEKTTVFADNLNVPTGVLPYGKGCIAWSIPNLWYFEDTDGDGCCDKRTVLFGPLGFEKDTHGMVSSLRLAPDGWVYATHGFSNVTHLEVLPQHRKTPRTKPTPNAQNTGLGPDALDWGNSLDLQSGNVFRFRPDGSAVEIWGWGQVNPFGLTWDAAGNLYSADCHSNPLTQLIRGAFYPSFGKPHDGLGFGPVLCEHAHGSTGICGPLYIDGGVWGPEWDNHMLVCNPVTSRVNHDTITFTGSTPRANEQPDFIVHDDAWFRPVDLRLAPDGSLYIADSYNKIIGHYEVPLTHPGRDRDRGRLWRIVKDGAKPVPAGTGRRDIAGPVTADSLRALSGKPGELRLLLEAVTGQPDASLAAPVREIMDAATGKDASLAHTARIALRACLFNPGALASLGQSGNSASLAAVVRTMDSTDSAAWLLDFYGKNTAPAGELAATLTSLARHLPTDREADIIALARKQAGGGPDAELSLLEAVRTGLAQRGGEPGAAARDWAGQIAQRLIAAVSGSEEAGWTVIPAPPTPQAWARQERACTDGKKTALISSFGTSGETYTGTLRSRAFPMPEKLRFFLCGHRGPPDQPEHKKNFARLIDAATGAELARAYPPRNDTAGPVEWSATPGRQVRMELVDGDNGAAYAWLAAGRFEPAGLDGPGELMNSRDGMAHALARLAQNFRLADLASGLETLAKPDAVSPAARAAVNTALASLATDPLQAAWLAFRAAQPASAPAGPATDESLAAVFKTAPTSVQAALADALVAHPQTAQRLVDLVKSGKAPARLLTQPALRQKLDAQKITGIDALTRDLPPASAEADALIAARIAHFATAARDLEAGKRVFTTHCVLCHQIGGVGNIVGPQLDGAGNRGLERLCEDILDPNRAVDPAFHLHMVKLKDGSLIPGLVRREEGATLVLADATGKENAVAKANIESNTTTPLSLMPPSFGQAIPEADFHHLMAWLLSQSQKK